MGLIFDLAKETLTYLYESIDESKVARLDDVVATGVIDGVSTSLVKVVAENSANGETVYGYMKKPEFDAKNVSSVSIPASFGGIESLFSPTKVQYQLFRISEVIESDDYVTVKARHVWYDNLANYTLWTPTADTSYSAAAVCRNVMTNAITPAGLHVASDCTDTKPGSEFDYTRKNLIECFLDPDNGICAKFGLSIIRNNWDFYCLKNVGYDRGFVIEDKKNLLGVERTESIENLITRTCPVGSDESGNIVWLNNNGVKYVDSSHINDYAHPYTEIFETGLVIGQDDVTADNIQAKLLAEGQKRFSVDKVDIPEVEMKINFLSLGDTDEYSQYRDLDKVYLHDIVTIYEHERGYQYTAQVVGIEYDIITESLNAVTIGNLMKWDGVRKIAVWQVPEIDGTRIRRNSVSSSEIATNAIQSRHFSESSDGHFKTIFAEQLYISNTSEDGLLNTRFSVSEGNITALVEKTGIDYLPAGTSIYGQLTVEAGKVAMVVGTNSGGNYIKAAEIATSINNAGQGVALISADHVNISATSTAHLLSGSIKYDADGNLVLKESSGAGIVIERTEGQTTAQYGVFDNGNLTAGVIATKVNGVNSTYIYADKILMSSASGANTLQVEVNGKLTASEITAQLINAAFVNGATFQAALIKSSGNIIASGGIMGSQVYVGSSDSWTNISDGIASVRIDGPTNNQYKLQYKKFSDSSWQDAGTFSPATALSGAWSSGKFTVTASPQGTTFWTNLVQGTVSWSGNSATVPVEAIDSDNQGYQYATGRNITVDATARYNAGKTDGNTAAGVTGSWGSGASANVYAVTRAANTSTKSLSCTVTAGVSISYDSSTHKYTATGRAYGNAVERKSATATSGTEAYDAGYNAGYNKCIDDLHLISDGGSGYYCYNSYNDAYLYAVASDYANGQWYKVVSNSNKSPTVYKK